MNDHPPIDRGASLDMNGSTESTPDRRFYGVVSRRRPDRPLLGKVHRQWGDWTAWNPLTNGFAGWAFTGGQPIHFSNGWVLVALYGADTYSPPLDTQQTYVRLSLSMDRGQTWIERWHDQ